MSVTKTFGRYLAEIEPNEDRPGKDCWIQDTRNGSSASLCFAENEGYLHDGNDGADHPIGKKSLELIGYWARKNGY
jgi:hypothetical protein